MVNMLDVAQGLRNTRSVKRRGRFVTCGTQASQGDFAAMSAIVI